jgi:hypothetical protein
VAANKGAISMSKIPTRRGRDHRGKGRLNYIWNYIWTNIICNLHETGEWFLKGGVDSPENLLAYDDFDDTLNFKKASQIVEVAHSRSR